jgi:hypothetical protein
MSSDKSFQKTTIVTIIKEGKSTDYHYLSYRDIGGLTKRILHRENGPAIESKMEKRYFINGKEIFFQDEKKI